MKTSISFVFVLSLTTFISVQGLFDECTLSSSTSSDGCRTTHAGCCSRLQPCAVLYKLTGSWETKLEISTNPTLYTCPKQCKRHFHKCVRKCRCLSYTNEAGSTAGPCKCVRSREISAKTVFTDCRNQCKRARRVCRRGCFASLTSQKCLLKAATKVDWTGKYPGRCQRICKPEAGTQDACPIQVEAA